jgi:hypothetical protein
MALPELTLEQKFAVRDIQVKIANKKDQHPQPSDPG